MRFAWKPEYSVGDAGIDLQHIELIAILNELADLLQDEGTRNSDAARTVFDHLACYVTSHFSDEEERMARTAYPEDRLAAHRAEHNVMLRQVQEFEQVFEAGNPEILAQMLPFLYGDWLIHHICGTDRDYMPYLAAPRR